MQFMLRLELIPHTDKFRTYVYTFHRQSPECEKKLEPLYPSSPDAMGSGHLAQHHRLIRGGSRCRRSHLFRGMAKTSQLGIEYDHGRKSKAKRFQQKSPQRQSGVTRPSVRGNFLIAAASGGGKLQFADFSAKYCLRQLSLVHIPLSFDPDRSVRCKPLYPARRKNQLKLAFTPFTYTLFWRLLSRKNPEPEGKQPPRFAYMYYCGASKPAAPIFAAQ
ncbi:hypothetical protein XA68_17306 [Ophiocordyceps unilateralis]|uniref:Uncharacterized protein n=1 Tax=Ophiocordyceps unilateralis TaxID=268505 RepID=A0A2A9PJ02_OPHUN|nr:hypothetical protein XA68_17306 [Ophiocordyceps unilateralis]